MVVSFWADSCNSIVIARSFTSSVTLIFPENSRKTLINVYAEKISVFVLVT